MPGGPDQLGRVCQGLASVEKGRVCQGGPKKTGMQPAMKASVRRWLDWEFPGMMRQKTLPAMASSMPPCGCTFSSFSANSLSVHATCTAAMFHWKHVLEGLRLQKAPAVGAVRLWLDWDRTEGHASHGIQHA